MKINTLLVNQKKIGYDYLKLRFAGILMYFCKTVIFDEGTSSIYCKTSECPTKKAVIGMIGACLGIPREDHRLDELYESLTIKYRIIQGGTIVTDFQRPGPNDYQKYGTNKKLKKFVEYLCDAKFDVFIGGDKDLLSEIYDAICSPVYSPYFGKKACIPYERLVGTDFVLLSEEDIGETMVCP